MVHFVGAGPGATDLITVRGAALLTEADVVIYAGSLVNPKLLEYVKKDAQIYNSAILTLDEIISVMEEADKKGRMVVRLHSGEPSLYGTINEQMRRLDELGIGYTCTPGVTAAFGAASSLKMEYTLPEGSQSLIITRMEGRTKVPSSESIESFAAHKASMAIYLSAKDAGRLKEQLLKGGYAPDTPVAVVYRATWDDEKKTITTLDAFAEWMAKENIRKQALIIVGDAVRSGKNGGESRLYDPEFSTEFRPAKYEDPYIVGKLQSPETGSGNEADGVDEDGVQEDATDLLVDLQIIVFTKKGNEQANRLVKLLPGKQINIFWTDEHNEPTGDIIKRSFRRKVPLLFIGAIGICTRMIAPYITDKLQDSAVVVMDETGCFVIPVLSGHVGGANRLARKLALVSGAEAVITTATDLHGLFSVDEFAARRQLSIQNRDGIARVAKKLLLGNDITVTFQDDRFFVTKEGLPGQVKLLPWTKRPVDICVCDEKPENALLWLKPKTYVIGLGCRKGTSLMDIEKAVAAVLRTAGISLQEVSAVASVDQKKDEPAIIAFCRMNRLEFRTYPAETLKELRGDFSHSDFVEETIGVDNVCERAAEYYSLEQGRIKECVVKKTVKNSVTTALYRYRWKVIIP